MAAAVRSGGRQIWAFRRADVKIQGVVVVCLGMGAFLLLLWAGAVLSGEFGAAAGLLFVAAVLIGRPLFLLVTTTQGPERFTVVFSSWTPLIEALARRGYPLARG